jgi:hypothetical protein
MNPTDHGDGDAVLQTRDLDAHSIAFAATPPITIDR